MEPYCFQVHFVHVVNTSQQHLGGASSNLTQKFWVTEGQRSRLSGLKILRFVGQGQAQDLAIMAKRHTKTIRRN